MSNIYKVFVYGKSFIEAFTESEAAEIAIEVDLVDGIFKVDLEVSSDEVGYYEKNPCTLNIHNLESEKESLDSSSY